MHARRWPSLAILLLIGGLADAQEVTIYRCTDTHGGVTLQDEPCAAGQRQERRQMQRPKDPPTKPPAPPGRTPPSPPAASPPPPASPPPVVRTPPPPLWQCTTYDGDVRYSETLDPNPRCVPLAVLGYDVGALGATCRWIEDSCVWLSDAAACEQYARKLDQAESDALHAFSDTQAYRDSEVRRLKEIVRGDCR